MTLDSEPSTPYPPNNGQVINRNDDDNSYNYEEEHIPEQNYDQLKRL